MIDSAIFSILQNDQTLAQRFEFIVSFLKSHFDCDAVALLKVENRFLKPVAVSGLENEVLGRRFDPDETPRIKEILSSKSVVHFTPDCTLSDPYDGLVQGYDGVELPVHDCVGVNLTLDSKIWGVLTFDSLSIGTFTPKIIEQIYNLKQVIEIVIRVSILEALARQDRYGSIVFANDSHGIQSQEIIGKSDSLLNTLHELDIVSESNLPVLLLGETGVGKELFAKRLHQKSQRSTKPMLYINCAALPDSLAESELFGHKKGAFTGAQSDRSGKFELADGGTLFLDEIGELSLVVQAKLLRALQNGEIQRLGSDTYRRVNVRIVAATNRDLEHEIQEGNFRSDLYHRLSVYPIKIPPLRDRIGDVALIAGHFLEQNRVRLGLRSLRLSSDSLKALTDYHWPGNIRELEHVISRSSIKAFSLGKKRDDIVTITPQMLDLQIKTSISPEPVQCVSPNTIESFNITSLKDAVDNYQKSIIDHTLKTVNYNFSEASRILDIDPSNLRKMAIRLGIQRPK